MIDKLNDMIGKSSNIVFFGGAGVSTESGIPDFRSAKGLYNKFPEEILSATYFENNTGEFFEFYRKYLLFPEAPPNKVHLKLAELERVGKLKAIITQNIDNLHQKAGSKNVIELHGSVYRNYCVDCGENADFEYVFKSDGVTRCKKCGGIVRPDVVLYEESLDGGVIFEAVKCISLADMLIIGGTSLVVHPAAGLVNYYRGDRLVIINKSETFYDNRAALCINDNLGSVFEKIIIN